MRRSVNLLAKMVLRHTNIRHCSFVVQHRKHYSVFSASRDHQLHVYNTRTRRKEPLKSHGRKLLLSYICGPTVYDSMHLGHAYTYTQFDIIRRVVEHVTDNRMLTCMNITDIDDKIIKRANETGVSYTALADRFEQEFWHVIRRLNVRRPEIVAPVSRFIPVILSYIEKLVSDGHAYVAPSGSVYFDVKKCGSRYGSLRGSIAAPNNVEIDQEAAVLREKKDAADFAVWKHARPDVFGADEPQWSVPWDGNHRGRPGWHTECAALSSVFFGRNVDLHFGGSDLQFPHHENECAQNLCFHNIYPSGRFDAEQQWVNHWLHFGTLLNARGEKMSKSSKNYIAAEGFIIQYGANAAELWRMFCCLNHYRRHPVFRTDDEAIDNFGTIANVQNVLAEIEQFKFLVHAYLVGRLSHLATECVDADILFDQLHAAQAQMLGRLLDDFDVPGAMTVLTKLLQEISALLNRTGNASAALKKKTQFHTLSLSVPLAQYVQFIDEFYAMLGLRDNESLSVISADTDAKLPQAATSYSQSYVERVIDNAAAFRSHVRQVAISLPANAEDENAEVANGKKALLDDCDAFRHQLESHAGVILRDSKQESFWMFAGASGNSERKSSPVLTEKTPKDAVALVTKKKIFIKKTKQSKTDKSAQASHDADKAQKLSAVAAENG